MISKANAQHYNWGGDCDGWHLATSDALSVIHERMPPGRAEIAHHHERARQVFFVLSGSLVMAMPDGDWPLAPGEAIEIAPGVRHQAINRGQTPVEFLVISAPPTRGDRIECT